MQRERITRRPWLVVTIVSILTVLVAATLYLRTRVDELRVQPQFPTPGTEDVARGSSVVADFNRPLQGSGEAEALDVRVRGGDESTVVGALTFSEDLTSLVFKPLNVLSPGAYDVEVTLGDGPANDGEVVASWSFSVPPKAPIAQGPGGPILLVLSASNMYDETYTEILRAEGLNSFTTIAAAELSPEVLAGHAVAILTEPQLSGAVSVDLLTQWVEDGGDLIAIKPEGNLAALGGISPTGESTDAGYISFDTSREPGAGLTSAKLQIHDSAQVVDPMEGTTTLASIGARAGASGVGPAVTLREVGASGGSVASLTYNLAQSVVLTRQGNPEWAGRDNDGVGPVRSNDLFRGSGEEADHLDMENVATPQADEQMRFFSKLIAHVAGEDGPLPRFWYFPNDVKAVLVMAADDHGTASGTEESFDRMLDLSPDGCVVEKWECPRATSWMYPSSGMSDEQAAEYSSLGFDLGAHVSTHCNNWTEASLDSTFSRDLRSFWGRYPSVPHQNGSRLHCIAWSAYTTQAEVARNWGIRFDMNYYYWPATWARGRVGFMTGSGLPMRFNDPDSGLLNVFQQETHLVNETWDASAEPIIEALDRALGPEGHYGAFGTHYDFSDDFDVQLMRVATERGVPMVSAQQMLDWTDGRNASRFDGLNWDGRILTFGIDADRRTHSMLRTLLPTRSTGGELSGIRGPSGDVEYAIETIKGVEYAAFPGEAGEYSATYGDLERDR